MGHRGSGLPGSTADFVASMSSQPYKDARVDVERRIPLVAALGAVFPHPVRESAEEQLRADRAGHAQGVHPPEQRPQVMRST